MSNTLKARLAAIGASATAAIAFIGSNVHAAADTALVADATAGATALTENGQGVSGELIVPAVVVAAGFGLIALLVRYVRRLMK